MRNTLIRLLPAVAIVALAGQLAAGGFFLVLGNPEASPEARKLKAVLTVKATGCHDPGKAKLTAAAVGYVNGQRREIPLRVDSLSTPGMFALTQQWPKEGRWVIQLTATNDEQFTNTLVTAGPGGVDRNNDKADHRAFTSAEVDAMLK